MLRESHQKGGVVILLFLVFFEIAMILAVVAWDHTKFLYEIQSAAKLFEGMTQFVSKKLILMQFYERNIYQGMIFRLYTVYNKRGMIKIGNQTREKLQALSQVLE